MSKEDGLQFGFAGLVSWVAASAFYLAFGASLLEAAFWFYVLNAVLTAGAVLFIFQCMARLRHVPRGKRLFPALAFALPGLAGGPLVLANFETLSATAQPESLGRYGAFLVFAYAAVIATALERPQKGLG